MQLRIPLSPRPGHLSHPLHPHVVRCHSSPFEHYLRHYLVGHHRPFAILSPIHAHLVGFLSLSVFSRSFLLPLWTRPSSSFSPCFRLSRPCRPYRVRMIVRFVCVRARCVCARVRAVLSCVVHTVYRDVNECVGRSKLTLFGGRVQCGSRGESHQNGFAFTTI